MTARAKSRGLGLVFAGLCLLADLQACSARATWVRAREPWSVGFWLWAGEPAIGSDIRTDVLYVEVARSNWPAGLPDSARYMALRRLEPTTALTDVAASNIAADFRTLVHNAGSRPPVGLQIDYDCPTSRLDTYARFLAQLRRALPPGSSLSVTALLDWFGPRTAIAKVLQSVDEFVPQFYDTAPTRPSGGIGTPIDARKWAPILNAYGVPYRIGIASFGRVARWRRADPLVTAVRYFRDASPLDFAGRREFVTSARTTPSGELVVRYDVMAAVPNKPQLRVGDAVDITFPTEGSVRAAFDAARHFGGYCAGVIFFRWPNRSEGLAMIPDDVQRIVSGRALSPELRLDIREAPCLSRHCVDVSLDLGGAVVSADRVVEIAADGPLELFLPSGSLNALLSRGNEILVRIPAYAGMGRVYVGRTISRGQVRLEVVQP